MLKQSQRFSNSIHTKWSDVMYTLAHRHSFHAERISVMHIIRLFVYTWEEEKRAKTSGFVEKSALAVYLSYCAALIFSFNYTVQFDTNIVQLRYNIFFRIWSFTDSLRLILCDDHKEYKNARFCFFQVQLLGQNSDLNVQFISFFTQ